MDCETQTRRSGQALAFGKAIEFGGIVDQNLLAKARIRQPVSDQVAQIAVVRHRLLHHHVRPVRPPKQALRIDGRETPRQRRNIGIRQVGRGRDAVRPCQLDPAPAALEQSQEILQSRRLQPRRRAALRISEVADHHIDGKAVDRRRKARRFIRVDQEFDVPSERRDGVCQLSHPLFAE